jgi:XrtN system VIT domain protein
MLAAIKKYFTKEINILGSLKSRFVWILIFTFSILFLGVFSILLAKIITSIDARVANILRLGSGGIVFIIFMIILFRIFQENRLRGYILVTLSFTAIAFIVEKYFLNSEIISPFTTRTTLILWLSFLTLFLSIFYKNISKWILLFFPPILLIGFLVSLCFVLIMIPFMPVSWVAILFLGLGILPYTPIMACIAFLVMCYRIVLELKDNKYYLQYTFSKYLTYATLIFTSLYFIWFHTEWNKGQFIIRNHFLETKIISSKRSLIDDDFPAWASLGMKLPVNHVSELYLQPESNNKGVLFKLFGSDKLFDPFAFVISNISKKVDIPNEDREHLLKLLFGYTHISLNRLWNGNSIITTDVETRLQFYPESRVAYTEMKIGVYNEANFGQQEAIYTIKIPDDAVCTKLALWIDGKEEIADLIFLSKAQTAYNTIKRNPSYVTWMEDNLLRVRLFPVTAKNYRTFKIGFISPLKLLNQKLHYQRFKLEGPLFDSANHRLEVDVSYPKDMNLSGTGYTFEKKISREPNTSFSKWFAYGKYKEDWTVNIDNPPVVNNEFIFSDLKLTVTELKFKEKEFNPDKIYILINSSLSKKEWKSIYSKLTASGIQAQIILVTNEWFYSKNKEENLDFIDSQVLPKFNLFPFYKITNDTDILIITNKEDSSIPFSELKGSSFFNKNKEFFSKNKKNIYVQPLNKELSAYFNSLKEYELIQDIPISLDSMIETLKLGKINIPYQTEDKYSFVDSKITIQVQKQPSIKNKTGNDVIARLLLYKKIMRILGKQIVAGDKIFSESGLVAMAELGGIVTPLTSFIVPESKNDYYKFGFHKNKKELDEASLQIEDSKTPATRHGNIPEPEEWIMAIICILLFFFWKKFKLNRA